MKKLIPGILKFQNEVFPKNRTLYQQLASGQQPETLFIACSDSRVVPHEIMQTGAGELFVCRNAGNIVPPYNVLDGTVASVEYAVEILKVKHIVVCGHSDCGAMKGLLNPEKLTKYPAIERWLRLAERGSAVTKELHADLEGPDYLTRLIEENVITQLETLNTYPCIAGKVRAGSVSLHGITFNIGTGEVRVLEPSSATFAPLSAADLPLVEQTQHL